MADWGESFWSSPDRNSASTFSFSAVSLLLPLVSRAHGIMLSCASIVDLCFYTESYLQRDYRGSQERIVRVGGLLG
jgi:hypothetical protein